MTDDTRKGHPLLMPFPLMPFLDETAELSKGADRWVVKRKPRTYAGGSVPGSARRKQQSDAVQAEVARLREVAADVLTASELTSHPRKIAFAKERGWEHIEDVHGWMRGAWDRLRAALAKEKQA